MDRALIRNFEEAVSLVFVEISFDENLSVDEILPDLMISVSKILDREMSLAFHKQERRKPVAVVGEI